MEQKQRRPSTAQPTRLRIRPEPPPEQRIQSAIPDAIQNKDQATIALLEGLSKISSALQKYLPDASLGVEPDKDTGGTEYRAQMDRLALQKGKLTAMEASARAQMRIDTVEAANARPPLAFDAAGWVRKGASMLGIQEEADGIAIHYPGSSATRYSGDGVEDFPIVRLTRMNAATLLGEQ